jgi:hypothetical protein
LIEASALCAARRSDSTPRSSERALQLARERAGAGHEVGVLGLELLSLLLGGFQILLTVGQLLVHEGQRIGHLAAPAREVFLAEDVDHLLHDVLRELGVLRIGIGTAPRGRADLEQVVLLADHLDLRRQARNRRFHLLVGGHLVAQTGRADDLFEVDRTRQRLAHAVDVALGIAPDADLVGKHVVDLDEDARLRFVGVGHHGHDQPPQQAHHPGNAQRQPAPVPDAIEGDPQFIEDVAHRPCILFARPLRTRSRE